MLVVPVSALLAACAPAARLPSSLGSGDVGSVTVRIAAAAADVGRGVAVEEGRATPAPSRPPRLACLGHPAIDAWERRLRGGSRLGARRLLARGKPWVPKLETSLAARRLPPGLALLPAIESGFDPRARGAFDSAGLWQLQSATARGLGLVVTRARDDRLDPNRATRAAARYLARLHARYDDWPLALAAYNAGGGRVDRALARRPEASFWELAEAGLLPETSAKFVPRFLALVRLQRPCDGPRYQA